jgi:hypothetical protein
LILHRRTIARVRPPNAVAAHPSLTTMLKAPVIGDQLHMAPRVEVIALLRVNLLAEILRPRLRLRRRTVLRGHPDLLLPGPEHFLREIIR